MMKSAVAIICIAAFALTWSTAQTLSAEPRIQFVHTTNDFGWVVAGALLKHDFIFTNTGTAPLRITDVKANCGCTTAGEWSREVLPGQTGVIPLQFQTPKLDLLTVKEATVSCNDSNQPLVRLELRATLWRPVAVEPEWVVLNVTNRLVTEQTEVVRIVNQEPTTLILSAPVGDNRLFEATLKTNIPGREYELHIRSVPPLGNSPLSGHFILQTSSTNQPEIRVGAYLQMLSSTTVPPVKAQLELGTESWLVPVGTSTKP